MKWDGLRWNEKAVEAGLNGAGRAVRDGDLALDGDISAQRVAGRRGEAAFGPARRPASRGALGVGGLAFALAVMATGCGGSGGGEAGSPEPADQAEESEAAGGESERRSDAPPAEGEGKLAIDGSSEEAFRESLDAMFSELEPETSQRLRTAITDIAVDEFGSRTFYTELDDETERELMARFDGMTADDVIEKAEELGFAERRELIRDQAAEADTDLVDAYMELMAEIAEVGIEHRDDCDALASEWNRLTSENEALLEDIVRLEAERSAETLRAFYEPHARSLDAFAHDMGAIFDACAHHAGVMEEIDAFSIEE